VPSHCFSPNWHFYSDNTLMKRISGNLLAKRCTCITLYKCSVSCYFLLLSLLSSHPPFLSSAHPFHSFILHSLNLSKMADRCKCLLVWWFNWPTSINGHDTSRVEENRNSKIALMLPILIQTALSQLRFYSVVTVLREYSLTIVGRSMRRDWWACTVVIGEDFSWHALRINYKLIGFTGCLIFNFLKQSSVYHML
jgi:hypothetical protein